MAGRKPRVPRDEQQGVTSLKGERPKGRKPGSGIQPDGSFEPEFEGQREPFQPGHQKSLVHGAHSAGTVVPRAAALLTSVLEDAGYPDHVRSPMFRQAVESWCDALAVEKVMFEYLNGLTPDQMVTPRLAGTRSPIDLWRAASAHASRERSRLGLDPVSYAKLVASLGLGLKSAESAVERMAEAGGQIVERREAELRLVEGGSDGRSA